MSTPANRIFELRTYTAEPGRLADLEARFREHTLALFTRHGMENIGYWRPHDPAAGVEQLVYLIAHPSREAARSAWQSFIADPDWQKVKAASEANGKLVARIDSLFLDPTDFSPIR